MFRLKGFIDGSCRMFTSTLRRRTTAVVTVAILVSVSLLVAPSAVVVRHEPAGGGPLGGELDSKSHRLGDAVRRRRLSRP